MKDMRYNTQMKRLLLPEYGRNIQNMVDHCVALQDRDERTHCADSIIDIMGNMFPHLRDVNDFKHILWDHLAIMADFALDIDYPYEVVKREELYAKPTKLPYPQQRMAYKHYGRFLEKMIQKATTVEDGEAKDALIGMLANQMKRSFLTWNKEMVDDQKIFKDLTELSGGRINLNEESHKLTASQEFLAKKNRNLSRRQQNYK
ncbi:hypothetical protein AGMMS49965_26190 [Bacteroidia bacterium]|nr:hypothetical protein AGMMS4957_11800 [Bacteroidia bacterium]GHT47962.1 hypothetical protein AGMMS49965_26190 [Bacteroidia bacterium]